VLSGTCTNMPYGDTVALIEERVVAHACWQHVPLLLCALLGQNKVLGLGRVWYWVST
jgi:hypothetical protein